MRHATLLRLGGSILAALPALALLGCSGHGNGGPGDPLASPLGNEYGPPEDRISQLISAAPWYAPNNENSVACGYPIERQVLVTGGILTAIDRFDETGDGSTGNVYIQDPFSTGIFYSGLTVYNPGFSPPDMRVMPGDVVDVLGVLQEFPGPSSGYFARCVTLPEMGGSMSFRFEQGDVAPTVIDVRDLTSYPTVRQWMGMLVTIENAKLGSDGANSSGRYSAQFDVGGGVQVRDVPTVANELFDLEHAGFTMTAGTTFHSITGIVSYFYGTHVSPRSAADIVP